MLKNTDTAFGSIHRGLHWLMAFLILGMICVGLYMASLDPHNPADRPLLFKLVGLHKATGMVILSLVLLRVIWLYVCGRPLLPETMAHWQRIAARTSHVLLYILMFAMPLSGYTMSSLAGHPVDVYGLFKIPAIFAENKALAHDFLEIHEFLAFTLITVIVIHVCGALKHHFIDRDNVLKRMLGIG